jgi:hypothetical protein
LFSEAGRAEVLLNPGTVLRIGEMTRIRMDSVDLTDTRVSIEAGSAVITVNRVSKLDRVEIHVGGAVVVMKSACVYRFDADRLDADTPRLRVFRGQAEAYREEEASSENGALKENSCETREYGAARGFSGQQVRPKGRRYAANSKELKEYIRDCLHRPVGTN